MRHLILLLPVVLVACATTGSSGEGSIAVETASKGQPVTGANCVVHTNSGNWNVVTPASVNVGGVNGDLRVVCNKQGYRTSEFVFTPSGRPYGSSIGLGVGGGSGHVGAGLGLSVPIGLGGGRGYPSRVTVELNPQ